MRVALPLIALLLATACGEGSERRESSETLSTYDVAEAPPPPPMDAAGPAIAPSAAPGVAFNYRYAFRLPSERIASVQERHAQACERLGLARCRITGMRYRLVSEEDVEGMLAFKLDPTIARQFGKAGIETVAEAEGMLIDSEISGVDAGAAIQSANRTGAQLTDDLRRVEQQLARAGLSAEERARLQSEAQQLRQSIRANSAAREEQQESLATTPVVFQYGSGELVPGFDDRSPFSRSVRQAADNLVGGLALMLLVVGSLLPWIALGLLVWWIARRVRPRLPARSEPPPLPADEV